MYHTSYPRIISMGEAILEQLRQLTESHRQRNTEMNQVHEVPFAREDRVPHSHEFGMPKLAGRTS